MAVPESHEQCPDALRDVMAERGVEITVSTLPPLVVGPYTTGGFTCPHGTTFFIEPTGEQISRWSKDGVR
jgi:hypothetical protein